MIETTVKIDGMMCSMCESHVNDAIRNHLNVKKVSASHGSGYTILSVSSKPYEKKKLFSFGKK